GVAQQQLEAQVKERTAALTSANEKLVREAAERERAEARVRHSEDNLRKLFEVDPEKMEGQRPTDYYVNPEERERLLARVAKEGHVENFEAMLKTANGR